MGSGIVAMIAAYFIVLMGTFTSSVFETLYGENRGDAWLLYAELFFEVILLLAGAALLLLQVWLALAVCVRRLHDCDFPGWPTVLIFLPYVGGVVLIGLCLWFPHEPNRYGENPRQFRKAYDA
ncbi:DUF805 domain-containing protein [Paraburkholderia sediminicola]|uniref:DUF805 domain-containing protein n=1 Tax=Paraburkholderia sediminicola TaxID=458836 RepID=UPI0038B98C40